MLEHECAIYFSAISIKYFLIALCLIFCRKFYNIMELFLFRPAEYERLYNCSRINIESVPLERRQHLPQGIVLIALTAIYLLLYIPCIASIWKHRKDNACYAILFYISVTDILELFIIVFLHGWLSVRGDVFCSHPQLNYIAGVLCMECFWFAESMADMLLAFERCLEVLSPNLGDILFKGKRVLLWLAISTVYGCYNFVFSSPPGVYNGVYFCYFFNPFLGYIEDTMGIYTNEPHVIYDMVVSVSIPVTYLVFFILLIIKSTFGGTANFWASIKNPMLNQAFIQVLAISMFNLITLSVYVYMKYTGMSSFLTYVVHFSWLHIHGFPPVIYLLLNKTIRKESKKFIKKYAVFLFGANFVNFVNTAVSDGANQKPPRTVPQSNKINCNTNISHINRSFLPVVAN